MSVQAVGAVAKAIEAVAKLWKGWIDGAEKRRAKKGLDYAEKYIFANEGSGIYKDISDVKREAYKRKYRKVFFDNNQL